MYGLARVAGYLALLLTPLALLGATVLRAHDIPMSILGLEAGVVLTGSVAAAMERDRVFEQVDAVSLEAGDAADALAVVVGAVLTYLLSVPVGLGPVLASALVGLVVGIGVPRVAVPAYCGSFVGMASPHLFPSVTYFVVAGAIAAAAFVATEGTFGGFGGKLGTTALFGCMATVILPGVEYASGSVLPWASASVVVPVAIAGAVVTVVLSVRLGLGVVVGSALVGVVSGVAFPALSPELGSTLAAVAFCASFVGMSTTDRLVNEIHVAFAGAVCGLVFIAVSPAFAGADGKLGTIAFISCVASFGATTLADSVPSHLAR